MTDTPKPRPADPSADPPTDPPAGRAGSGALSRKAMDAFLAALAETGLVDEALRRSGAPRAALYRRRARQPRFAAAWDQALAAGLDGLRDAAVRRALEGVERPLTWRGETVGAVRQYPDALLMFLLRAYQPQIRHADDPAAAARAAKAQEAALRKARKEGGAAAIDELLREIDGTTRGLPSSRGERA